ncbi:MAG: phosphohistidine phosphatase SixA [Chloroflexi bacterium]|jgi:phosphohistidine phosphatase|nr:phosphohistidine phosphatase SixA [Chloroflexota bacterium]
MSLFLVQHGKSLPPDIDPERGLSEEGISEVEIIASMAKSHGIGVASIQHSGKKRAQQTADIFAIALNPKGGVEERNGINPMDDVEPFARGVNVKDNVMLVGHLPFMERLVSYLITGSTDRPVIKFQNGGIVCLEQDPYTQIWIIKWTLLPHIN